MSSLYSLNTFTESYMTLDNLTKSSDIEKTIFEAGKAKQEIIKQL